MNFFYTLILYLFSLSAFSQSDLEKIAQDISAEGKLLYKLEIAAWHGTDIFMESFKERKRIGGYFSYIDSDKAKCLFFSKGQNPRVIGVVSFGDIQIVETATIDFKERDFKSYEKDLYNIRSKALLEIQSDSLFKTYSNTNLNLIPFIKKGEKKVYALTGSKVTGVVLFGNDYLLKFDDKDNVLSKTELHKNLIPIHFDDEKEAEATVHSHAPETGDFITPTDICTLMLYAKFAKWKQHYVISKNFVSIWDCSQESLSIVTRKDFEKMGREDIL